MKRVIAIAALILLWHSSAASAEFVDGGADLGGKGNMTGQESFSTRGATSGDHNSGKTPVVAYTSYSVEGDTGANSGSQSGWCHVDDAHPKGGFWFRIVGRNTNGDVVSDKWVCVAFTDDGSPAKPPIPQPPTIEEVWGATRLPHPDITTDPANRGITGLETRITTNGPKTVSLTLSIRGYTLVGTARLDHYTISIDGGPEKTADHDAFTFETKGNHTITISAVWYGTARLSGPDIDPPISLNDIGQATMTSTRTYPVHEIRSVLQP